MYDLHCHILPNIDDGPSSVEETRIMLEIAAQEGIKVIAATHHFNEEELTVADYLELHGTYYKHIQSVLEGLKSNIQIVTGAEVMISPFLLQLNELHNLCINGSRYLLIELPMMDVPEYTQGVIYNLRIKGITPIIAHPERNRWIMENPALLIPLIELGTLIQVNSGSITGDFGRNIKRCVKFLVKHNMVHLVATDAHSADKRPPRIRKAAQTLKRWVDQQRAEKILYETPQNILNNVMLQVEEPVITQ